jgi:riboflavin biosynthesis pyrimidine reductase
MRRLWPDPADAELTDEQILAGYETDAPVWLRMNMVTSMDGAVTLAGRSEGLSSPDDHRLFRLLRALVDVVLVGAGTVRNEGYRPPRLAPELARRRQDRGLPPNPRMAVVSHRLDLLPAMAPFAEAGVRPLILTHSGAPADRRAELAGLADLIDTGPATAGGISGAAVVAALHDAGLHQVLCEGGPHLLGALTAADAVDEFCLAISPQLTGPGAGRITAGPPSDAPRRMTPRHVFGADDGTLFVRYVGRQTATK